MLRQDAKSKGTCTECAVRRQRCNKEVPCSRCLKQGIPNRCIRSWDKHFEDRGTSGPGLTRSIAAFHEPGDDTTLSQDSSFAARSVESSAVEPNNSNRAALPTTAPQPPATLEFLTWEKGKLRDQNVVRESLLSNLNLDDSTSVRSGQSIPVATQDYRSRQLQYVQSSVPSLEQIWHLVNFHEKQLLWNHGCYHGPTFNHDLASRTKYQKLIGKGILQILPSDLQWSALLLAIMAGSISCANDDLITSWGFQKPEAVRLSRRWYKSCTILLSLGEYTTKWSIHSVQAIGTLTTCAHILGFSSEQSVLMAAVTNIAKSLGLHRIQYLPDIENVLPESSEEQRKQVMKREMGRRLWSQLCIQDWFSIAFTDTYSINPLHMSTLQPSNRDHLTMEMLPASVPTYVSYSNYLFDIAKIVVELHDAGFRASTVLARYAQILEYDAKLRKLATEQRPIFFDSAVELEDEWPSFIGWARRSLIVYLSHTIIMIHRDFLAQSFAHKDFVYTRKACVAAAKTIVNEVGFAQATDAPILWTNQAFCVVAGIILALDVLHRSRNEPEYTVHRLLVQECIDTLERFTSSTIAVRGARLIGLLLEEIEKQVNAFEYFPVIDSSDNPSLAIPKKPKLDFVRMLGPKTVIEMTTRLSEPVSDELPLPSMTNGYGTSSARRDILDLEFSHGSEIFPAQTGLSNTFLFDELLNFPAV